MTDSVGEQLLAAIRAAPDDRALRLVYADWLMERGDPRGEWIALSCGQDSETTDQEMRRRALWQHHGAQWESEDRVDSGLINISYRDGFPDAATLARPIPSLLARHPLRALDVRLTPGVLGALAASPLLETVRCLYLDGGWDVTEDEFAAFLNAPALAHLDELRVWTGTYGGPSFWPALARFRRVAELKQLHVEAEIGAEEARWLGRACPALEALGCWAGISDSALRALAETATFRLRRLKLDFTGDPYLTPSAGAIVDTFASPMMHELASLSVMSFDYEVETAGALARLPPTLRSLRVGGKSGDNLVAGLEHCRFPALETLCIWGGNMTNDLVGVVARFPTLSAFEVNDAEIAKTGAERIMSSLPRLERLSLNNRPLRAECVQAIAWSEQARSLRRLSLDRASVAHDAVASIVGSGHLNELRELSLVENRLDGGSLRELADGAFDHMERLCLVPTTDEVLGELFADGWVATHRSTYARALEPSGRAVARKARAK